MFTLLDVTWSAIRLLSLALGGLLVDALGIQPVFWVGGTLLAGAGLLGLVLLGGHDFRAAPVTDSSTVGPTANGIISTCANAATKSA